MNLSHPAAPPASPPVSSPPCALAPPLPAELVAAEVAGLPAACALAAAGPYVVYAAAAPAIPSVLHEIGRLREMTFRAVGEGTGKALDIDEFDAWYHHLFVWHSEQRVVAGAYRVGRIDEILAARGPHGLYTSTLFQYADGLLDRIRSGLELGRSFVRAENQKVSVVLLLLWRGIGQYISREPRYRNLIGPVSIDRRYQSPSLGLMVGYLGARHAQSDAGVQPRMPYVPVDRASEQWLAEGARLDDVDKLGKAVAALEPDGRGVPVLIRQYLRLGAEVLGFNVDPAFSDVVDALMLLDLERMDDDRLRFFMGEAEADAFRAWKG